MVSELSVVRQEQFVEWLRDAGDSQNYIRRTLSVGKSALLRAVRRQELTSAPAIVMPKRKKSKKYRMTLQEAAALFNAATTDHFRTYLLLAFATAQRPVNILELTTDRIDIEHRRIDFNPPDHDENKKRRPVVAICNTLVPLLERLAPGFAIKWKKNQKKPMKGIKTAFIAARDRAGLRKDIMPYTIRRTVATELRRRGVDVGEIAGLLGHTQPGFEVTELYAEYSPEYMSSAMKAIDDIFANSNRC
jgi:integrase